MVDDMGIFRTTIAIGPLADRLTRREVHDVIVDTGAEYCWIPRQVLDDLGIMPERVDRFELADGRIVQREVGWAMLYAGGRSAPTIVAFAEPGEIALLGAYGLEGLNMKVDLGRRELVPAGPVLAVAAA